jgi:hypothetical protein
VNEPLEARRYLDEGAELLEAANLAFDGRPE